MSQDSRYDEEDPNEFADITPYDNYQMAFRDSETKRRYQGQLEMFINPDYQEKRIIFFTYVYCISRKYLLFC